MQLFLHSLPGSVGGFSLLFGTLGQVIGLVGLIVFKSPIFLVPGFIPLFFDNATIALVNKFGGWKVVPVICTTNGIIQDSWFCSHVHLMELSWWQGSRYMRLWVGIIAIFKGIGAMLGIPIAG